MVKDASEATLDFEMNLILNGDLVLYSQGWYEDVLGIDVGEMFLKVYQAMRYVI
jgi:hypothetical protein